MPQVAPLLVFQLDRLVVMGLEELEVPLYELNLAKSFTYSTADVKWQVFNIRLGNVKVR